MIFEIKTLVFLRVPSRLTGIAVLGLLLTALGFAQEAQVSGTNHG